MLLEDRHIEYLRRVEDRVVTIWWNPSRTMSRYVSGAAWGDRPQEIDQIVAAQMHTLGLTHIVFEKNVQRVELTPRGLKILLDEDEAWA